MSVGDKLQLFNELTETCKKGIEMMAGRILMGGIMKLKFKTCGIHNTMHVHYYFVFNKF